MILSREQAKALADRVLALSKADETMVTLTGGQRGYLRFARNSATTSGASTGYNLAVTASFGKKSGTATTAEFVYPSLQRAVRTAEEIARLSPENPEYMPVLGAQSYAATNPYFEDVAGVTPGWRASAVATAIELSKQKEVVSAGFVDTSASLLTVASSKGLYGYVRQTAAD